MMTPHNSSLAYESLPTEEGGAPRSTSYRDADFSPSVSQHPIVSSGSAYGRGKLITGVLVALLLLTSVVLGLIIAISARKDAYHRVFGPDLDVDFTGSQTSLSGNLEHNIVDSDGYFQPSSGNPGDRGETGEAASGQEAFLPPVNTSKIITFPPLPSTTTTSTTTPTTTTTLPTTTTTIPTTTTTTTTTTTSTTTTTPSTTTTPPPTTPEKGEPATTAAAQYGESPSPKNDTGDTYNSGLRAVDYMVILQKKMSPGVALAVLVALVVACAAGVVAVVWVVRRSTTTRRRREHVRRAINELRDQGKTGLLQSDDEA